MFWVLFGLVWLISPIILFPLSIHRGKQIAKYERFINALRGNGRISQHEYNVIEIDPELSNKETKETIAWVCPSCGRDNISSASYCAKCGKPDPKLSHAGKVPYSAPVHTQTAGTAAIRWECKDCGYHNASIANFCAKCGSAKPVVISVTAGEDIWNDVKAPKAEPVVQQKAENREVGQNTWNDGKNSYVQQSKQPVQAANADTEKRAPEKNAYAPVDEASSHSKGETIKTVQQTNLSGKQAVQPEKTEAAKAEEKWVCPSCKQENKSDFSFCTKCGHVNSIQAKQFKAHTAVNEQQEKEEQKTAAVQTTATENKLQDTAAAQTAATENKLQDTAAAQTVSSDKKYFEPKQEAKPAKVNDPLFNEDIKPSVVKPAPVQKVRKERPHYDSSTILFGIGVVFVILAGIIFSTAFWVKWSDITRTGVIAAASAFFFGISWLSKKKFKLDSTSGAMFVTGSVFTAITVVTAGYLQVFGTRFSLIGDMKWLFYMCGMVMIGLCSFCAEKIYKKPGCRYITIFSTAVGATFLTAQFAAFTSEPAKVFGFLTAILGAAASGVYVYFHRKDIEISKVIVYSFVLFRVIYAFAGASTLFVELMNMNGSSIWGWGIILLTIFECFIYMFGYEQMRYPISLLVESVMVALAAWQLRFEFDNKSVYIYLITGFAVITTAIYNYLDAKGKTIIDAKLEKYALRIFFALLTLPTLGTNFTHWGECEWILCGVWAAEMLTYGLIKVSFGHLLAASLFVEAGILEMILGNYFPVENTTLAVTLFSLALGVVFNFFKAKDKMHDEYAPAYYIMRIMLTVTVIPCIVKIPSAPLTVIGWTVLGIFLAETLVYAILHSTNIYMAFHGAVLLFMLTKAREVNFLDEYFTLCVTIFAAVAYAVYYILKVKQKLRFNCDIVVYGIRCGIGIFAVFDIFTSFTFWSPMTLVVYLILLAELTVYAILEKSRFILALQCLFIIIGNLQFIENKNPNGFIFFSWLFVAVFSVGYVLLRHNKKARFNADIVVASMRVIYGLLLIPLAHNIIYTSFNEWHFATLLTIIAETLVYAIVKKSNAILGVHGGVLLITILAIRDAGWLGKWFTLSVSIFALVCYAGYYILKKLGKLRFNADNAVYGIRAGLGLFMVYDLLMSFGAWDTLNWVIFGITLCELTVYAILEKSNLILCIQCVFIAAGNLQFYGKVPIDEFIFLSWLFIAVPTLAYMTLRKLKKLRFNADLTVSLMRIAYGLLLIPLTNLLLNTSFSNWQFATVLLIMSEALIYAILEKSQGMLAIQGCVLMVLLLKIRQAEWLGEYFTLWVTIFGIVGYAVYYILKKLDMLRFKADTAVYGIRCALGIFMAYELCINFLYWDDTKLGVHFLNWDTLNWAVFALTLAELTIYAVLEKSEKILALQCIFLLAGNIELLDLNNADKFVFFTWLFAAVTTFVYISLRRKEKLLFNADKTLAAMRTIYAFFALLGVNYLFSHDINGWIVGSIVLVAVELGYYAVIFKNKIMLFINCVFTVTALAGGCLLLNISIPQIDRNSAQFIFSAGLTVLILMYRYIKVFRSKATDAFLLTVLFANSISLLNCACVPYGIISMMAFEIFMIIIAFSDKHYLAKVMRLLLSVPVLITCDFLCLYIRRPVSILSSYRDLTPYDTAVFAGAALMLGAVAYAVGFGIKQDAKKYQPMKYSFEIFSLISAAVAEFRLPMTAAGDMTVLYAGCAMMIASTVLMYAVIQTDRINLLSFLPLAELYYGVYRTFTAAASAENVGSFTIPISIALMAAMVIISRCRNSESIYIKREDGKKILDTAGLGSIMGLPLCVESTLFGERAVIFVILLEVAAFIANLYRTDNKASVNKTILTLSALAVGIALVERPFMVFEGTIWTTKIIIGIIVLFGIAMRFIWRENERFADESSKGIFMVAYVLLLADALMNQTVANSIIVLCTSLAILLFAFKIRSKRWFLISAAGLAGLTIYTTKDFFASLAWWLYLLIAGILLITIASVNEYLKGKGKNLKDVTSSYLDTWTW